MENATRWKLQSIIATAVVALTQVAWGDRIQLSSLSATLPSPEIAAEGQSLLELAKKHRTAVIDSSKIEGKLDDLEVVVHFYPDILQWNLLLALIEQLEEEKSA